LTGAPEKERQQCRQKLEKMRILIFEHMETVRRRGGAVADAVLKT
jgi:hypothetical protein